MAEDLLRAYDSAVIARFSPMLDPAVDKPVLQVQVAGLSKPAPIGVGLPEEWFARYGPPAINVTRGAVIPALSRAMPAYRSQVVNAEDATRLDIQRRAPTPVSIPYTIELAAESMGDMNVLSQFVVTMALPFDGFGTVIVVFGQEYGFRATGGRDKTEYATKDGRLFRYAYDYIVEGWLFSTDCDTVPMVGVIDLTLETYRESIDIQSTPPPDAALADEVVEIVKTAE